jgi:hypothetical protein
MRLTGGMILACVLFNQSPAVAVDGEILIDQAAVNVGGITPGDSAGFPATLSRPGRYKLAGNLIAPGGLRAIEVTVNDVTIDLNGFTIRGAPPGAYGIYAEGVARLNVSNGTITGFGYGVYASGGTGAVVDDMRFVSNSSAGVAGGQYARIRNSTIANNGVQGISCGQCLIEGSIVTGHSFYGILVGFGGGTLIGNVIVGNGQQGISSTFTGSGYGNNILVGNNGGGAQITGTAATQLHPNYCEPACP